MKMAYAVGSGGIGMANSVPQSLIDNAKRYIGGDYPNKTLDGLVVAYAGGICLGTQNPRALVGVWYGEDHPLLVLFNCKFP